MRLWIAPILIFFSLSSCTKQPEACMQNDKRTTQFFVGEEVLFSSDCSQNASSYRWVVRHNGTESVYTTDKLEYKFEETGSYEVALTVSTGSLRSQTSELVLVTEFTPELN